MKAYSDVVFFPFKMNVANLDFPYCFIFYYSIVRNREECFIILNISS